MENDVQQSESDRQLQILKFMQVTECESYEQSKFYVAMHNYILKNAVTAYLNSKGQAVASSQSTRSDLRGDSPQLLRQTNTRGNQLQKSLSPDEALILQKRLRSKSISTNPSFLQYSPDEGTCSKFLKSCKNSFNCFQKIKMKMKKKINSFKKDNQRIFYFQDIYHEELHNAGFQPTNDLIESYQLTNVEESQKIRAFNNQSLKPILAIIAPNRRSQFISSILNNHPLMTFIRQNFEVIFITLSQLKQIPLSRKHSIRSIRKCPTVITYLKNFYDLEDVLLKLQGQAISDLNVQGLKRSLLDMPQLVKKWHYLLNLEKHLKANSVTSLNQVTQFDDEDVYGDQQHQVDHYRGESITPQYQQHPESKRSLIQQQTKIYEEMVAQEMKRKKSIQLQRQKLQELKQLREVRKLSIPDQPSLLLLTESIEFRFRSPLSGEYISRRFLKQQKVDILYQFVDTNEKIEFQTEPERSFDLFTSFPPTSLSDRREHLLSDVFDQEKENVLIREV